MELLPSTVSPGHPYQFLNTYLFDEVLAVDAGSLGLNGDLEAQSRVRDIVLTHSHVDHIASLPMFLENVYGRGPTVTAHGNAHTLAAIRSDVFNDRVFPDLLTRPPETGPFLLLNELPANSPRKLHRHTVTTVPVNHTVPTDAVLVEDGNSAVLIVTDTGPTQAVWDFAATVKNLRLILLEVSFPESHRWLADLSGHLTPQLFALELLKTPRDIPILAVHLKPQWHEQIVAELSAFNLPHVSIIEPGRVYNI